MKPFSSAYTFCQAPPATPGNPIRCMCAKQRSSCSVRSSAQQRQAHSTGESSMTSMPLSFWWTPPVPTTSLLPTSSSSRLCLSDAPNNATPIRSDSWRLACKPSALQARPAMHLDLGRRYSELLQKTAFRHRRRLLTDQLWQVHRWAPSASLATRQPR